MTQRLETKIGVQAGLETNVQADQTQGFQIADNIIYRPIGGLSKRRGSKKLIETVSGETKRLISPSQDGTSILSVQEVDATGKAKVLGYKNDGIRVDLYAQEGTSKILLNPDTSFTPYDKIRINFDASIYDTYYSFIEDTFEDKIGVFGDGFFTVQTTFATVAVEQDSIDPDLFRIPRFVNLPTKNNEIDISNVFSLTVPSTLLDYDILSVSSNYFTIYPTTAGAPSWTSTGATGTLDITFKTFKVIDVGINALVSDSLVGLSENKIFFEVLGQTAFNDVFSTNQTRLVLEDRSGDEVVFNCDQGQAYLSNESLPGNIETYSAAYYGVERALDCLPYYFTNVRTTQDYGAVKEKTVYAYRAVCKKVLNGQTFLGSPSPFFFFETPDESANYATYSGANIGLTADGRIFINGLNTNSVAIQLKSVTATPAIPDGTQFKIKSSFVGSIAYISVAQQIEVLGVQVTALSQADIFENRSIFCDVCLPQSFWQECVYTDPSSNKNIQFVVDIYRTQGVAVGSTPDTTQFFFVGSTTLNKGTTVHQTPHIGVRDSEITDLEVEGQLPLYTNPTEEGALKTNDIAPRHQTFVEKNGVFYLGDLVKPQFKTAVSGEIAPEVQSFLVTIPSTFITNNILLSSPDDYFVYSWQSLSDPVPTSLRYALSPAGPRYASILFTSPFASPRSKVVYIQNGSIYDLDGTLITPTNFVLTPLDVFACQWFSSVPYQTHFSLIYQLVLRPYNLNTIEGFYTNGKKSSYYFFWDNIFPNAALLSFTVRSRYFEDKNETISFVGFIDNETGAITMTTPTSESFRYQIAYSKPFEPAAFPPLQFLQVGSTKNIIYGIFSVRDSLIIASKEGFYRLTGDNELDYTLFAIEKDTTPLTPLLMTEQQDRVYALTQKGIAACSESDLQIIDIPIQNLTERFLQLYRDDLDGFTTKQTYTAGPRFLNQIVFYLPSLKEKDTSVSKFGISYDTSYQRFSTVDLYANDEEKTGVLSSSFDASKFSIGSYSSPSFEPSALQSVRAEVTRFDFAQNENFISLRSEWQATASLTAGSSILTITTTLEHRLSVGDYVTLVSGGSSLTSISTGYSTLLFLEAVYPVNVSTANIFSVDLGTASGATASDFVVCRLGRNGLPALLSTTAGSVSATLTVTSERDVGWQVGQKLYILKPYSASLSTISLLLSNGHELTSTSSNTLVFNLPSASPSTLLNQPVLFSESLTGIQRRAFSFIAQAPFVSQKDFALVHKNNTLLFPFEAEDKGSRIQGFLERPLDQEWAHDRPSKVYAGIKSTLMTARITGGDPCSLKNFSQFILAMQSIFSLTKLNLSFQGDRYDAVDGIIFQSQSVLDQPFDPAFADTLWSTILQQWASTTNPNAGWKEAGPFTPVRITIPTSVSQSTYLSVFLRHDRPFETFALGSMAVNGVFIDPTGSAGV